VPVLIIDILKGWVPAFFFPLWAAVDAGWALAFGAAAITGHIFSIYMRFRGGKGVATGAGVFLAVSPIAAIAGLVVWGIVVLGTRVVSLASIAAALVVPFVVWVVQGRGPVFWLSVGLTTF